MSSSHSSTLLELLFLDVWGPTIDHKEYYVSFFMIIAGLLGYIYFVINLIFLNISLSFRNMLSTCLIVRSLLFSLTGVGSMRSLILFFLKY
jgi:hypothetical protein